MFFGPSKENQQAAEIIYFYTENITGDLLLSIVKNQNKILDSLFTKGELDLKSWTNTTQLVAIVYIFTSLSNSDVRGKNKLMELIVTQIKIKSNFELNDFMDTYSHFCEQMLSLISKKYREDRTEKLIFVLLGDVIIRKIKKLPLRDLNEVLNENNNITELYFIGSHVISPFMKYFR